MGRVSRVGLCTGLLVGLAVAGLARGATGGDAVRLSDTGERPVPRDAPGRHAWVRREIELVNAHVRCRVRYDRYTDPQGRIGGDPHIAAVYLDVGGPRLYLNVRTRGGLNLARQPFRAAVHDTRPDRKGVTVTWDLPAGRVVWTLAVHARDPRVYARLRVTSAKPVTITHVLYPGGFSRNRADMDRWVLTQHVHHAHATGNVLRPMDRWLLLYDKKMDPARRRGQGALGYAWAEAQGMHTSFECGAYGSSFRVTCPPGTNDYRFALWPFHMRPNAEAVNTMSAEGDRLAYEVLADDKRLFDLSGKVRIRRKPK